MNRDWESLDLTLEEAIVVAFNVDLLLYREKKMRGLIFEHIEMDCVGEELGYLESFTSEEPYQEIQKKILDAAISNREIANDLRIKLGVEITKAICQKPSLITLAPGQNPITDIDKIRNADDRDDDWGQTLSRDIDKIRFTGKSFAQWAQHNKICIPVISGSLIDLDPIISLRASQIVEYFGNEGTLSESAMKVHGEQIPERATSSYSTATQTETSPNSTERITPNRDWTSVSIRLLPDDNISYSVRGRRWKTKHLSDTMFVDKRKEGVVTPNKSFDILANLAELAATAKLAGQPNTVGFGAGKGVAKGQDRARKNKLCNALRDLVGIEGNPFTERSPDKGYQPHFTVEDKRHDSTQRDKRMTYSLEHDPGDKRYGAAQHEDDGDAYGDDEDDDGGDDDYDRM